MDRRYLYLLSFLEGSAVMACELLGARILAPYFGTSLYVWAAALGLTLGGLMIGYFWGGRLTRNRRNLPRTLFRLLILAGIFTALMPITGNWIMPYGLDLSLPAGTLLSLSVFLLPPLICMGMISPIIIHLLNGQLQRAGNSAGNVYAVSTLGGILMTFMMGFYVIPQLGVSYPAILIGLLLSLPPMFSLVRRGRPLALAALLLFAFCGWQTTQRIHRHPDDALIYHSEGILGQVKVIDRKLQLNGRAVTGRSLVVNNSLQSVRILEDPTYNFYPYTQYIPAFTRALPEKGRVLILGLGGGTLVSRLTADGWQVDVVDIDDRLPALARTYFDLPPDPRIIIDDARHYLRTCTTRYDLIIYDTFLSESAPEYMLTLEGMADAERCLHPAGSLLINFYGHIAGKKGKIVRSVHKTILRSGLSCRIFSTPGTETERNIIFVAGRHGHQLEQAGPVLAPAHPTYGRPGLPTAMSVDTTDAILLTDDRPQQGLYARAAAEWRRRYNQTYTREFSRLRRY